MVARNVIEELAVRMLEANPVSVVRFRLLRDVLRVPANAPELVQARQSLDQSRWVQELAREQWGDGSWGRLHSRDSGTKQQILTTEAGVERALALGLDATHPILQRAVAYLVALLEGAIQCRDRAERNDRWPTGVRLFAAATLAQVAPGHRALDEVRGVWAQVAARTFAGGAYDAEAEASAHGDLTEASVKGSYLVLDNKYALTLLSARPAALSHDVERTLVQWIWHRQDGIRYLGVPLAYPPIPLQQAESRHLLGEAQAGRIEPWLASLELLSRFPSSPHVAQDAVAWLLARRTAEGCWDLGARAAACVALPLSESWLKKGTRAVDWTTRVLTLLRRYGQGRPLPLPQDGCRERPESSHLLGEDARPADVLELPDAEMIPQGDPGGIEGPAAALPHYIIRRIHLAHCKRGPERCEQCRQMNVEKISLLDISPPRPGEMQRRVIAVQHRGEQVWREFDVVRTFDGEAEARRYAAEHGIEDVEL